MLKSFLAIDTDDDDCSPDNTGIDWLDIAIGLANMLIAQILTDGRLAESGKATVLKTVDASKAHKGSNPLSSATNAE